MKLLQELLIVFSLANLLFIREWKRLIFPNNELFHNKLTPYLNEYLGLLFSVLITACLFFLGLLIIRFFLEEKAQTILKIIFPIVVLIAVNGVRQQLGDYFPNLYFILSLLLLISVLGVGALSVFKWQNYFTEFSRWVCLLFLPLLIFNFSIALWHISTLKTVAEVSVTDSLSEIQKKEKINLKNRVIWIIFDELDYAVPFEKNSVKLPEFERLKQSSLFATNAIPPAYSTRDATVSLITGKRVVESNAVNNTDLNLKFESGESKFSEAPNIFRQIKSLNGETALVGWVNPYCRVIGKDLSVCQWHSFDTVNDYLLMPVSRVIMRNFQSVLNSVPFGSRLNAFLDSKVVENTQDKGYLLRHQEMINASREIITNPKIDLAFIHLPFPHPPNYYNAEKKNFEEKLSKDISRKNTYLDNLVLTDKVLEEFRKSMEDKDLWNNSTIIVSSDHQWRVNVYKNDLSEKELDLTNSKEDVRVPFFLKLKNQKESLIYEKPFNTIITQDLILSIIKGETVTVEDAKTWLDKNSRQ